MLLEAIIATTCIIGQSGCSEATGAYYQSNKELQELVKNTEKLGQQLIKGNEYIVYVATPAYAIASGQNASFKVYKQLIFNVNVRKETVGLQWSY